MLLVRRIGHQDAGARGEAARADAELHRIGAHAGQGVDGLGRGHVAGDDLDLEGALDLLDHVEHGPAVAVGGVDHQHVDPGGDQTLGPREGVGPDADRGPHPQAALLVLRRVRVLGLLLDVLDRDEPLEEPLVVDDRQLLDAVLPEDVLRLLERGAERAGDERRPPHHVGDGLVDVVDEAQVAVGQQPDEPAVAVGDGHARDVVALHERQRVGDERLGGQRDGVDDHARLVALDLVDLGDLVVDRQVAVDDADAAGPRDGDGQARLGDGVHRGGHDGDGQLDPRGEPGGGRHVGGQHRRLGGHEEDVVEGEALAGELRGVPTPGLRLVVGAGRTSGKSSGKSSEWIVWGCHDGSEEEEKKKVAEQSKKREGRKVVGMKEGQ